MAVVLTKRRFTVEESHRMGEAGILTENDRVELIEQAVLDLVPLARARRVVADGDGESQFVGQPRNRARKCVRVEDRSEGSVEAAPRRSAGGRW